MTEKEFDQKVEDMAARFERGIEASAAKLEKGVTHKYGESRLFRFTIRGIFIAAEIGLLIGGKSLVEKDIELPQSGVWPWALWVLRRSCCESLHAGGKNETKIFNP